MYSQVMHICTSFLSERASTPKRPQYYNIVLMALPLRVSQRAVERRSNVNVEQRPVKTLNNRDPASSHARDVTLSTTIRLAQLELLVQ